MTDKLEPGWYWVKRLRSDRDWVVMAYDGRSWFLTGTPIRPIPPAIIGPRLTPPEGSS